MIKEQHEKHSEARSDMIMKKAHLKSNSTSRLWSFAYTKYECVFE